MSKKKEVLKELSEDDLFLESNIPKDFKDLDQTFRCQICASLFDKAVTIKECGHTFCSVCIRDYWVSIRTGIHRQKTACPTCRTPVNGMDIEKALVMNRSIQDGVKAFRKMILQHNRSSNDQVENSQSTCFRQRRRRSERKSSATIDNAQFAHEGETLASGNDGESGDEELPIHKKMESRNYSRMKKRELKKLCRDSNISTSGSEQELIDRLRNYQSMWNAEVLHSIDPKKPSDIAAKINKKEKAQQEEKKLAQTSGASNIKECIRKLNANIKSGNSKFTSGNITFDRELKANFKVMAADLQARRKKIIKPCTNNCSKNDGSLNAGQNSAQKHLSCGIGERISLVEPTSSHIEMIDIESSSDKPDRSIKRSTIDMKRKPSLLPPSHSNASPGTKLSSYQKSSFNCHTSSLCSTEHNATKSVDQRLITNNLSDHKKRRTSPASSLVSIRVAWACGRCTYENKGIDYVCQICGHRKL